MENTTVIDKPKVGNSKVKLADVKKNLTSFHVISQSIKKGTFTAKKSYFYSNGMSPETLSQRVLNAYPNATIVDKGDHWHSFVGGTKSGSPKDSYMWVEFKLN